MAQKISATKIYAENKDIRERIDYILEKIPGSWLDLEGIYPKIMLPSGFLPAGCSFEGKVLAPPERGMFLQVCLVETQKNAE